MTGRWRICVDTGGTFTDCIGRDPHGTLHYAKVLSSGALRARVVGHVADNTVDIDRMWTLDVTGFEVRRASDQQVLGRVSAFETARSRVTLNCDLPAAFAPPGALIEFVSGEPAPTLAARLIVNSCAAAHDVDGMPPFDMRLATTRGTNALLERDGSRVVLFITRGFADALWIGNQQRSELFSLMVERPPSVAEMSIEVDERLDARGNVVQAIDVVGLEIRARAVADSGITAAAIVFMHSYRNNVHERQARAILERCGFTTIACSSDIAPLIRLVPRGRTTLADAYLDEVVGTYLRAVERSLGSGRLHVMTSAGGLVSADTYRAKDSLLSGPAGGVSGAVRAAGMSGFDRIIGFDMGGTSTDVSRYDRKFEYSFEHAVGDVELLAPALAIETVAAGGGSICAYHGGRLVVGPESARAVPGPACYGAGGPLTLTDVNLLLGRIDPAGFEIPLDVDAAKRACSDLIDTMDSPPDRVALLQGLLDIANERMGNAIGQVSLKHGANPAAYALVAFGGAGGQHACSVAARLGISTVVIPANASLLSAVGLDRARPECIRQRQILLRLGSATEMSRWFAGLEREAIEALHGGNIGESPIVISRRIVSARLLGQETTLDLDLETVSTAAIESTFRARYTAMYGHRPADNRPIEIESIRVVAQAVEPDAEQRADEPDTFVAEPIEHRDIWFAGRRVRTAVYDRPLLRPGATLAGPALVVEPHSVTVVEPGWNGTIDIANAIVLSHVTDVSARAEQPSEVALELFANRLMAIANDMGQVLERTAVSTNVKDRLDFSCTILDAEGELVVNAPHMPVHLGAMGLCVRSVRESIAMEPGDVIVTNHPRHGGSHLPDITVITPVFSDGTLLGYVASRAHHAEIGGIRPGSMPPNATSLAQEGVVIEPTYLVRGGQSRFDEIEHLLTAGKFPSRCISDNLADLRAQVAANQRGADGLRALALQSGDATLPMNMEALQERARRLAAKAIATLPESHYEATERLDDGAAIAVRIDVKAGRATIDFTGTASQHPGNLNATPAIVRSAVLYVIRLMIGEWLPLNEGILRAVELRVPPGMLNPVFVDDPELCPAVVGGNVETSQRLVDTLLRALGLAACSQGTMNNTLFGNDRFGYYETICGGSGAGPGFAGCDAVHTHMTNTRLTDPETIEHRYPVHVERFQIRRGSGGPGRWRGGDGVIRAIRFLEPMAVSVLGQHRRERPYGMAGGSDGQPGGWRVERPDGAVTILNSIDGCDVNAGDVLVIETPGGGGWGSPAPGES